VLTRFGLERLLYRLSISEHRDQFLLKGAMLFALWFSNPERPTRDVDLLAVGDPDPDRLAEVFRSLCEEEQDDGLMFDPASVSVTELRGEALYPGLCVKMQAQLAGARIDLQVDVGFGDAVLPGPVEVPYPVLLDHAPPQLRAYPAESVVSEKLHAITVLGMANSRMKDFFDLWVLSDQVTVDRTELTKALRATFERRQTPLPAELPIALTAEFYGDALKARQWQAFVNSRTWRQPNTSLESVVERIAEWLWPIVEEARQTGDEST
jgi:predicted nucleotidyltransferase component of viral defense system